MPKSLEARLSRDPLQLELLLSTRLITLPDPEFRKTVVEALARLLLEAAGAEMMSKEVLDDPA